eukprot:TRINITY_DN122194_c0_g1_i1.p1 TRINITY_DN122194_c0_g1~~TRINITY_DN122194_c0_g1_i1.p1  ORF type:complete len:759 (-),score=150.31 TRINITY_DN122194_c0_g1_i1:94-2037(-)
MSPSWRPEPPRPISNMPWFRNAVLAIILLNTLALALEAIHIAQEDYRKMFERAELVFTTFYLVEMVIRIGEAGIVAFLSGRDWAWHLFDLLVIAMGVIDTTLDLMYGVGAHGASVVRVFRVLRLLRPLRSLKFFSEIDFVIVHASRQMLNFSFIVAVAIFIFAILATNFLWDCPDRLVADMFPDLFSSMWTLFKMMTMDGWIAHADLVIAYEPYMLAFFGTFIFFSVTSVSIVPSIFIETWIRNRELQKVRRAKTRLVAWRQKEAQMLRELYHAANSEERSPRRHVHLHAIKATLSDSAIVNMLQEQLGVDKGDLLDVKLGIWDAWEARPQALLGVDPMLTEEEFVGEVLQERDNTTQTTLWRAVTLSRLEFREAMKAQETAIREMNNIFRADIADLGTLINHKIGEERQRLHKELEEAQAKQAEATQDLLRSQAALKAEEMSRVNAEFRLAELSNELAHLRRAFAAQDEKVVAVAAASAAAHCVAALTPKESKLFKKGLLSDQPYRRSIRKQRSGENLNPQGDEEAHERIASKSERRRLLLGSRKDDEAEDESNTESTLQPPRTQSFPPRRRVSITTLDTERPDGGDADLAWRRRQRRSSSLPCALTEEQYNSNVAPSAAHRSSDEGLGDSTGGSNEHTCKLSQES